MRAVLQRVTEASVTIDGQKVGEIGKGIMVLFGMLGTDTDKTIDYMLDKVINLRIFEDENGKTNLALKDVDGELLLISQFVINQLRSFGTGLPCFVVHIGVCVR